MEIVTIIAILVGPILAVQAQRIVDRHRERRERKLALCRTLMASRVARAADPRHTEALNLIGIEFHKERAVIALWRDYMAHLSTGPATDAWIQKWTDLFVTLLYEMAQALGYKEIDKTQIRQAYAPILYENLEKENTAIRKALIEVLTGQRPIGVVPGEVPSTSQSELPQAGTMVLPVGPKS
jgi:hypothetical protein